MTEKRKERKHFVRLGPLPADDPIYQSGYIMLRPIRGRKQIKLPSDNGGSAGTDDLENSVS